MRLYVASAGTGKTHALVEELLALLRQGVPLRRMAAVTFTRKAAEELRRRIQEEVANLPPSPWAEEARREAYGAVFTTIHGFMAEALRHAAPLLSLDPDFALLDEFLAEALFLEEARSLLYLRGLDPALEKLLFTLYKKRSLAEAYRPLPGAEGLLALYQEALQGYRRRTREALGPSDLEALALRLLEAPRALERVVERFPHLLVDEFQDVNPLQGRFFQALEAAGAQVVAVGDPKQSIYLFRNARVEVFRQALGEAKEVRRLGETRRHAQAVAQFLNRFVGHFFPEAERVSVESLRAEEGWVEVHWVVGEGPLDRKREGEAALLAERLRALSGQGYAFSDMAVLVRSRRSLPFLERAFRALGVPYVLRRGQSFFRRPEVRDIYHALRLALLEGPPSPEERLSLLAFLRGPFLGLDLGQVEEALQAEDPVPLLPLEVQTRLDGLKALGGLPPLEALKALARDEAFLRRLSQRARANLDTLLLLAASQRFPDIEALLEWLKVRAEDPETSELPEGGEGVALLTVHAAKGLEWPVVAVFDLARGEGGRPEPLLVGLDGEVVLEGTDAYQDLKRALSRAQEEESLRLLYVALSRARDVLILTGSASSRPGPWAEAFRALGLGPEDKDPLVRHHPLEGLPPLPSPPSPPPPTPRRLRGAPHPSQALPPGLLPQRLPQGGGGAPGPLRGPRGRGPSGVCPGPGHPGALRPGPEPGPGGRGVHGGPPPAGGGLPLFRGGAGAPFRRGTDPFAQPPGHAGPSPPPPGSPGGGPRRAPLGPALCRHHVVRGVGPPLPGGGALVPGGLQDRPEDGPGALPPAASPLLGGGATGLGGGGRGPFGLFKARKDSRFLARGASGGPSGVGKGPWERIPGA